MFDIIPYNYYTKDEGLVLKIMHIRMPKFKNHIGNICAVVNSMADTTIQSTIYYASGVPMAQSWGKDRQPYLYNGKEFVEAHGLNEYDSQARMYYAPIMRTTTMDPLTEKYYHISPYAWCGNNPVMFVDPDGMATIHITGRLMQEVVDYAPDEMYKGNDEFIQSIWSLLDAFYQTESGKTVIDALLDADGDDFNITEEVAQGPNNLAVCSYTCGKREFKLGGDFKGIETIGHEFFHAYQDILGYGGASCANDVEAYLFQGIIAGEMKGAQFYMPVELMPIANSPYQFAIHDILYDGILDSQRLVILATGFKQYSYVGAMGVAEKYTTFSKNQQYKILNFWGK